MSSALLLEDGSYLLLEDGTSHLLLESSTVSPSGPTIAFDSWVSGMPSGYATTATVTPKIWNGSSITAAASYAVGAVVESSDQAGSYGCRITIPTSAIAQGDTIQVVWAVGGQTAVDARPLPPSAVLDGDLTPNQAINQILAAVAGILSGVPTTGPATLQYSDPTGANARILMPVAGDGNRTGTITHTPPVA